MKGFEKNRQFSLTRPESFFAQKQALQGLVAFRGILGRFVLGALSIPSFCNGAGLERISEIDFNKSDVKRIYMAPGRGTLIDFPCHITRASVGSSGDLEAKVATTSNSELDLWLKSDGAQSTNLIVRCQEEVFVFDVVPNRNNHQDYIRILGAYKGSLKADRAFVIGTQTKPFREKKTSSSPQPKKEARDSLKLLDWGDVGTSKKGRPEFFSKKAGSR